MVFQFQFSSNAAEIIDDNGTKVEEEIERKFDLQIKIDFSHSKQDLARSNNRPFDGIFEIDRKTNLFASRNDQNVREMKIEFCAAAT